MPFHPDEHDRRDGMDHLRPGQGVSGEFLLVAFAVLVLALLVFGFVMGQID